MTSKTLVISAIATAILMAATALLIQPQIAYATTTKSKTISWSDCRSGVTNQGKVTVTVNTPPTNQATYSHSLWPANYDSTTSVPVCGLFQFIEHKDTMRDVTKGWSCTGTTTTRNNVITWTFCSGNTISFGDTINPKTDTRYFSASIGYETKTADVGNYVAN